MINHKQIEKLKANWGDNADSMNCRAEVRFYDPLSAWQCYVFAMNPSNENEVECIIKVGRSESATTERWFLSEIYNLFNSDGEGVVIDNEYRPQHAAELFKKLNQGY